MWLSPEKFSILSYIKNNRLITKLDCERYYNPSMGVIPCDTFFSEDDLLDDFQTQFSQNFKIHYITNKIQILLQGNSFEKAYSLVDQLPDCRGLILHSPLLIENLLYDVCPNIMDLNCLEGIWYYVGTLDGEKIITFFFITTDAFSNKPELLSYRGVTSKDGTNPFEKFLINFLLFYNFTEPSIKEITGGTSTKKLILKNDKIINDSPNTIEIIDENFFKTIVRTDGFGVNGHFRLQACGNNLSERKLIYIEPFKKSGYTKIAKSLR